MNEQPSLTIQNGQIIGDFSLTDLRQLIIDCKNPILREELVDVLLSLKETLDSWKGQDIALNGYDVVTLVIKPREWSPKEKIKS